LIPTHVDGLFQVIVQKEETPVPGKSMGNYSGWRQYAVFNTKIEKHRETFQIITDDRKFKDYIIQKISNKFK
jgi:hypothetical protein